MERGDGVRRCRCGTRLARDNRGRRCSACQKAAQLQRARPPVVPAAFWQTEAMQAALATRDMGQVVRRFGSIRSTATTSRKAWRPGGSALANRG